MKRLTALKYILLTLVLPLIGFILLAVFNANVEEVKEPIWSKILLVVCIIPIAINVFLGPTIYSFWNHKKSRVIITVLNVACFAVGAIPGLLLWIWALA